MFFMNEGNKTDWWALIIDKLIIALIVGAAIWYLEFYSAVALQNSEQGHNKEMLVLRAEIDSISNEAKEASEKELELLRSKLNIQSELQQMKQRLEDDFKLADKNLENILSVDSADVRFQEQKDINKQKLDFISKQLSEFYWPVFQRLEKNRAVFNMMGHDVLGDQIAHEVVIPNHLELLGIFEEKMYLAQANDQLKELVSKYIAHVHMYQALVERRSQGFPQQYGGEGYPEKLYYLIKVRTDTLQSRYDKLLNRTNLSDNLPDFEINIDSNSSELVSFDYQVFSPTIKQSYLNNNSFLIYMDQENKKIKLILKQYIWDNKICIFEIDDNSGESYSEEFYLSQDEPFDYKAKDGRLYRIHLLHVWKQRMENVSPRKRTRVSVKIESWNLPNSNTSDSLNTSDDYPQSFSELVAAVKG